MRGKVRTADRRVVGFGITPAYAGKSTGCSQTFFWHQDHPRLCGEKAPKFSSKSKNRGSPPPMRGKAAAGKSFEG